MSDGAGKWKAGVAAVVVAVGGVVAHSAGVLRSTGDDVLRAGSELRQAAKSNEEANDIVCFAIGFYEWAVDPTPTYEEFLKWVGEEIDQVPRERAKRAYEAATTLYEENDLSQVDDIACEVI